MPKSTTIRKVAGYVRQSKDEQRGDGDKSIDRQRARIERLCRERGWELVAIHTDLGRSAAEGKKRPELDRLLGRLVEVDAVVFWRLDRLARSLPHLLKIAKACEEAGVQLVATDGEIDTTTAAGVAFFQMRGVFAQFELATTTERYKSMMAHKREKQEWVGKVPFGWTVKDKRLEPDGEQQERLREAASAFIGGATYAEVAKVLGPISASRTKDSKGKPKMRVPEPTVVQRMLQSARTQEALGELGDELAVAIRQRSMDRSPTSSKSLLGGIARCAECGRGLRLSSTRAGRKGRWTQYRCVERGHVGIAGPWLEEFVSGRVLEQLDSARFRRSVKRHQRQPSAVEVVAIQTRIEELEDAYGDGTLDRAAFTRQRDRQLEKLEAARRAAADEAATELPLELAKRLPDAWPRLTTGEQRRIVRALVSEVRVSKANGSGSIDPRRVELVWR